jgi:hypothetical protein
MASIVTIFDQQRLDYFMGEVGSKGQVMHPYWENGIIYVNLLKTLLCYPCLHKVQRYASNWHS